MTCAEPAGGCGLWIAGARLLGTRTCGCVRTKLCWESAFSPKAQALISLPDGAKACSTLYELRGGFRAVPGNVDSRALRLQRKDRGDWDGWCPVAGALGPARLCSQPPLHMQLGSPASRGGSSAESGKPARGGARSAREGLGSPLQLREWVSQMAIAPPHWDPHFRSSPFYYEVVNVSLIPESFRTSLGAVEHECTNQRAESISLLPEPTVGKREAVSVLSWSGRGKVVLRVNILFLSATPRRVALETFLPKNEGLEAMETVACSGEGRSRLIQGYTAAL